MVHELADMFKNMAGLFRIVLGASVLRMITPSIFEMAKLDGRA